MSHAIRIPMNGGIGSLNLIDDEAIKPRIEKPY